MVTGKMLINESHKYFTNVSFHISTISRVEPNNLSLANLTLEWTWNICDILIKSTMFSRFLKVGIATSNFMNKAYNGIFVYLHMVCFKVTVKVISWFLKKKKKKT